ncbi:MAG: glycosyltransferase [Sulfobacillus sp.]
MRITLVISDLRVGGAETQVIAIARELSRRGHAIAIYTLNSNNPRAHELDGSAVQLVSDQKRMKLDIAVILRLRRFLKDFRAEIVHGFLYDGDLYSRLAVIGTDIPVLNSERDDNYMLTGVQQLGFLLTRRFADGLVANTYAGAQFSGARFRLPPHNVHVVWNGIDLAAVDARCKASRRDYKSEFFGSQGIKLATLIGQIRPHKDYLFALDVADVLTRNDPSWRVLFVGEHSHATAAYAESVMSRFQALGLKDRSLFAGLRRDAVEIMHGSDVVFSTSLHEGFPNVVLEAMAARTPVVSTDYSDIRRILPEPWQVVDSRDAARMASTIIRAHAVREHVKARQRAWVAEHVPLTAAANRLESVYSRYIKPVTTPETCAHHR